MENTGMETYENLSRYKIFLAVAECKSISKAASQLYISQPAVSITIKKLEDYLNTTLFIRKPKGVELTENGRKLYENAKRALNILSDTEDGFRFHKSMGYLRIAASNVLCKYVLMPYLKEFTGLYPDTDISITCTSSTAACAMVEQCSVDLALAAKPEKAGTFVYHSLGMIEYSFVCTQSYRDKLQCDNDKIFERGNIILLDKDNVSRKHLNNYYVQNKINPLHILEVNEMDMLIEFAKMGIGVSCVVRQFVEDELNSGSLIEIELAKPIAPREIGFIYNCVQPMNENIFKFINLQRDKAYPSTET